jgi:hypothetical protein
MNLERKEYEEYRRLSVELEFEMNDIARTPYEEAVRHCNGIGPDWFPEWLRRAIGALHPSLVPVAVNHDLNWAFADGSADAFHATNNAFRANGFKMARSRYGAFDPRRYWVMHKAAKFHRLLDEFGGLAYKHATREAQK